MNSVLLIPYLVITTCYILELKLLVEMFTALCFNVMFQVTNSHIKTSLFFLTLLFLTSNSLLLSHPKKYTLPSNLLPFLAIVPAFYFSPQPKFQKQTFPFPLISYDQWAGLLCQQCLGWGSKWPWLQTHQSLFTTYPPWFAPFGFQNTVLFSFSDPFLLLWDSLTFFSICAPLRYSDLPYTD